MSEFDFTTIDFQWSEDPRILASRIDGFARAIDDFVPPLVAARQIIIDDISEHFVEERGPDGPWAEYAESYASRGAQNIGKLRQTEDLFEAVTSPEAYPIVGGDIFVNPAGFPDYWAIQNYGGKVSTGQAIHRRRRRMLQGDEAWSEHGTIPARTYMYISDEAEGKIAEVFDTWFTGELGILVSPMTGVAQEYTPGPGGIGRKIGLR